MTDLNMWHELVQVVKLRSTDPFTGEYRTIAGTPIFNEYVQVPLSEYQIDNLIKALEKLEPTGDWHGELMSICRVAKKKAGYK